MIDPDPDPTCQSLADPDPDGKKFRIRANTDPQHCYLVRTQIIGSIILQSNYGTLSDFGSASYPWPS